LWIRWAKELKTLPYLGSVVEETLLLHKPVLAKSPAHRTPLAALAICAGYSLPLGTTLSTQAYSFPRDLAFSPDPLRFNPDCWLNYTIAMKKGLLRPVRWLSRLRGHANCLIGVHARNMHVLPHLCGSENLADNDDARDDSVSGLLHRRSIEAVSEITLK
jgi:hypothetical protein